MIFPIFIQFDIINIIVKSVTSQHNTVCFDLGQFGKYLYGPCMDFKGNWVLSRVFCATRTGLYIDDDGTWIYDLASRERASAYDSEAYHHYQSIIYKIGKMNCRPFVVVHIIIKICRQSK